MLCESVKSDQEEKQGYLLDVNPIINLNIFITNIDKILLCKACAHERALKIKLGKEKYQENFAAFVEVYFQLTSSDEKMGIRELHQ